MFTVAIIDFVRGISEAVDFKTEAEAIEYIETYTDDDIDFVIHVYDESDKHYYFEDGALVPINEDYGYDFDCEFDPYEGRYIWYC